MRGLALIALAACGSSADAPKPPPPAAPKLAMLVEAARLATTDGERLALARAYLARGDAAQARATLALVRADPLAFATEMAVLDVRTQLGDAVTDALDAAARRFSTGVEPAREQLERAFAEVESTSALAAVASVLVKSPGFADLVETSAERSELAPKTARWRAVVDAVGKDSAGLLAVAKLARRMRATVLASELVHLAAETGTTAELAEELELQHDHGLALEIAKRIPTRTLTTDLERTTDYFERAILEATLGNRTAAERWEARALALVPRPKPGVSYDDVTSTARAMVEAATGHIRDVRLTLGGMPHEALPPIVFALADHGWRDAAEEVALVSGANFAPTIDVLVRLDVVSGDLERAESLAIKWRASLQPVLLAHARAGDLDKLTEVLARDRSPIAEVTRLVAMQRVAEALAKQGKCERAVAVATELKTATTFALVARYCLKA